MLKLRLVCVGRLKAGAERELCDRYLDRARSTGRALGIDVEVRELAEARLPQPDTRKAAEAEAIRAVTADLSASTMVFDETGRGMRSSDFAAIVKAALEGGTKTLDLVIGGPDGLDPVFRQSATHVVALGAMTWPHQLVRVMVAEQIYRVTTMLSGHPYHRA